MTVATTFLVLYLLFCGRTYVTCLLLAPQTMFVWALLGAGVVPVGAWLAGLVDLKPDTLWAGAIFGALGLIPLRAAISVLTGYSAGGFWQASKRLATVISGACVDGGLIGSFGMGLYLLLNQQPVSLLHLAALGALGGLVTGSMSAATTLLLRQYFS